MSDVLAREQFLCVNLLLLLLGYVRDGRLEEVMTSGDLIEFDQSESQRLVSLQEDIKMH